MSAVGDAGVVVASGGGKGVVTSVTAADGSIVVAGTIPAPTISRAALTGDVTAPAGSDTTTLVGTANVESIIAANSTVAAKVATVAATDASVVVGGTATAPTVATGTLDAIATRHPPVASVPLNGQVLTGGATPVNPGDVAIKSYVDSVAAGLAVKASCQEGTAAALPTNTYSAGVLTATAFGALTVDDIAVAVADRVLVKNEVAQAHNGIYVVTATGGGAANYVLTRSSDMNQAAQIPGAFVFIEQGTINTASGWVISGPGPYTIGTTAIVWTHFNSTGAGTVTSATATDTSIVQTGTATINPSFGRAALTGDIAAPAGSNVTTLKATGPGATGPIGSTTTTPVVTIDAEGRVTALTSATIAAPALTTTGASLGADVSIASSSGLTTLFTTPSLAIGTWIINFGSVVTSQGNGASVSRLGCQIVANSATATFSGQQAADLSAPTNSPSATESMTFNLSCLVAVTVAGTLNINVNNPSGAAFVVNYRNVSANINVTGYTAVKLG